MLTEQLVAEIVRQRLGEPDASRSARYILLIPDALKATARKIAANRFLKHLLISDRATAFLPIDEDGKVDLADGYQQFHFLLEFLDCGQMFLEDAAYPLQKINSQRAALRQHSTNFNYYYIEGDTLFVKGVFDGNVYFAVPYFPKTLAQLPESEEVETMFISKIIELANMPSDAAEDGEK